MAPPYQERQLLQTMLEPNLSTSRVPRNPIAGAPGQSPYFTGGAVASAVSAISKTLHSGSQEHLRRREFQELWEREWSHLGPGEGLLVRALYFLRQTGVGEYEASYQTAVVVGHGRTPEEAGQRRELEELQTELRRGGVNDTEARVCRVRPREYLMAAPPRGSTRHEVYYFLF